MIGNTILSEVGNIIRFSNGAKLIAYAGIDASLFPFGEYQSMNNHMGKCGSPYLRKALFKTAFIISNNDPVLKAYYQKTRKTNNIMLPLELLHVNSVIPFMLF